MIIPKTEPERTRKLQWLIDNCMESQSERVSRYEQRRRWTLFGSDGIRDQVLYNKLQAHTDLVASFLYAADHCAFTVAAQRNADDEVVQQMQAVEEYWDDEFRDSGLAYQFAEAMLWSLCYDSMFLKFGWNNARDELDVVMVPPHNFGVFDESLTDLDNQQAFTHYYSVEWDEAVQRMQWAGMGHRIDELRASVTDEKVTLPSAMSTMLMNAQRSSVTDPLIGLASPNTNTLSQYEPKLNTTRVRFYELYVWDDQACDDEGKPSGDYASFKMLDPGFLLEDSRETIAIRKKAGLKRSKRAVQSDLLRWTDTNDFIADEHPFVQVRPFSVYDYFWGECHCDRLVNLQRWINTRLWQIHQILEMQVDPPRSFMGMMGLSDEKADALGSPGTWVMDMNPGAKVEDLSPTMPPDLFADYEQISHMFLEASGLTETVMGKGEQGVRGRGHAKQLATTGSARIKKTAVGLEPILVKAGDLALKLLQRNSTHKLKTDKGMEFVMAQVAAPWKMRVAGHSHSPLFADESRDLATNLFKAQAIDQEDLLRMLRPPGEANLIHKLRQRRAQQRAMAKANPQLIQGGKK
jgi:hypothetical protein